MRLDAIPVRAASQFFCRHFTTVLLLFFSRARLLTTVELCDCIIRTCIAHMF